MGSAEYLKLRYACELLLELHDCDTEIWQQTHNDRALKYFKSTELAQVGKKLHEARRLLDIKVHNYRLLEKV